jgi:hypothetical protein
LAWVAGCGAGHDARVEELWVIDFEAHGDDVAVTMLELDLDYAVFVDATMTELAQLYVPRYYPGSYEVRFVQGRAEPSNAESSICVRWAEDSRVGRGRVDTGNVTADYDCGSLDGERLGVFVDNLADVFRPQIYGHDLSRPERSRLFAKLVALTLAHEIGHGLGLEHETGIMAAFPDLSIDAEHRFTEAQERQLRDNLAR